MAAPGTDPMPDTTAEGLQAELDAWLAEAGVVGVTAAVVGADGVWSGAAGTDGAGTDLVPDAAMSLASITKTFTAAQVMALAGEGKVDLDAPIDAYVQLPFATNGATVRQVLNMRSGFPYDPLDNNSRMEAVSSDLDRSWTGEEMLALAADETARAGQRGGEQDYNNLNYIALGAMVEEVTGQPLAQVLRGNLLQPAGLNRAWFQDGEQPQPPLMVAQAYYAVDDVDEEGPWLPSRSVATSAGAAGAMAGDAADTARWGYLLYGGYLIEPGLVDQMTQRQQPDDFYGLGTELQADSVVGHSGAMASSLSYLRVWQEDDLAVAVLIPAPWQSAAPDAPSIMELTDVLRSALAQG
jgi:D-alanyl-D-alanine carboxypeptidase